MVCKLLILASISTTGLGRFFELPVWMPTNVAPAYIAYGTYSGNVEEWNSGSSTNSSTIPPFHHSTFIRFSTNNAAAVASAFDGMYERYYLGELGMQTEGTIDELHVSTNPQPRSVTRRLFEVPPDKWKYLEFDYSYWTPYREEWNEISNCDWERVYTNSLRLAHYADQYVTRAWLDGRGLMPKQLDAPGHKTNSVAATWGGDNLSKAMGDPGWVKFELQEMAPTNKAVSYARLINMLPVYGGLEPDDLFYSRADERNAASRNAMRVWPGVWQTIRDYGVSSGDYNKTIADLFGDGEGSYRRVWHTNQLDSVLAASLGLDLARLSLTNHWTNETMRFDTKLVGTMIAMIADLDRRYDVAPGDELLEVHCADYEGNNSLSMPAIVEEPGTITSDGYVSNMTARADTGSASAGNMYSYGRFDGDSRLVGSFAGGSSTYPTYQSDYTPLLSYPRVRFSGVSAVFGASVQFNRNMHGPSHDMIALFVRELGEYLNKTAQVDGRIFSDPITIMMSITMTGSTVYYNPLAFSFEPGSTNLFVNIQPIGGSYGSEVYMPVLTMDYAGWRIAVNDYLPTAYYANITKSYNCDSTVDDMAKVVDRMPKPEEELGAWPVSNVWRGATGDVLDKAKPHAGHTVIAIDYDARNTIDGKVRYSDRGSHTNVVERFTTFDASTASQASDIPYRRYEIMNRGNSDIETIRQRFFHTNGYALKDSRWVKMDQPFDGAFDNTADYRLVQTVATNLSSYISDTRVEANVSWRSQINGAPIPRYGGTVDETVRFMIRFGPMTVDDNLVFHNDPSNVSVMRTDGIAVPIGTSVSCGESAYTNGFDRMHYDMIELVTEYYSYGGCQVDPPVSIDCRQSTLIEKNFIFHNLNRENDND